MLNRGVEINITYPNIQHVSSDKGEDSNEILHAFSPGCLQATAVHYTVHVTLQYRYPPAEFSHSNSFAVSGGVHAFCMTRRTEAACKYSCAVGISRYSRSSRPKNRLVKNNIKRGRKDNRTGHCLLFFSRLRINVSLHPRCFMFKVVDELKGNS